MGMGAASFPYNYPHLSTCHTNHKHNNNSNSNDEIISINHVRFGCSESWPVLVLRWKRSTRRGLGSSTVTRAGPPTSSQFIFAFVFPLSLLAVTAFTAFRIGIRLDQKFLEELAINEAMREEEEEDDELSGVATPRNKEPALPPSRNRPRREV